MSIYRELVASSRSQAVARSRELGLLEGLPGLSPHLGGGTRSGARWTGAVRRFEGYGPEPAISEPIPQVSKRDRNQDPAYPAHRRSQ
jgi:hypothetical protein